MIALRRCAAVSVWTALLVAVACGGSSPTSPMRGFGGGATGAVITGTVNGASQGLTASSGTSSTSSETFATASGTPVTVTIVGTDISTTIDGRGHFHLRDVPVGDVQLRFTADNLDATITLRDIQAGDQIHIRVRVTDTSVRIEAEQRERKHDDDEFTGVVSGLSGTCPDITFALNGTNVEANVATRYEDGSCASVQNTTRVEVKGLRQADNSLLATRIELEDDDDDDDDDEDDDDD